MSSNPSRPLDIIVIGGGLAGLAAAGYLRQHNVTDLEKYPLDLERNIINDYTMSIVANAYNLLLAQGAKLENLEGILYTHLWHCSEDNDNIVETIFDTRLTFGAPSIFCRRSRLQAELYRLATDASLPGQPARILTNVNLKSIDPIEGIVVTDTGQTYVGDLIIGADGINSAIRGAILSQPSRPTGSGSVIGISEGTAAVLTGVAAYMSVVPAEVIASDPDLAFQAANGVVGFCHWKGLDPSKLRVFCYPRDCTKYFQVLAFVPETQWTEEFERNKTSIIKGVPAERTLKHFENFHPSVKKLIRYSPTSDLRRIRDINQLNNWTVGKTILIGDAAHAITPHAGQGCNMAIEDAEALGYLFRDSRLLISSSASAPSPEITKRVAIFQSLRTDRTQIVQFTSRQLGGLLEGEVKEKAGEYDRAAFHKRIFGYAGFEAVYKAHLAEEKL